MLLTAAFAFAFATVGKDKPITVKVLVLNLDPKVEGRPLHEYMHWNDPHKLAEGYMSDVSECSGGFIQYKIAEWRDVDAFPVKKDGFRYTADSFTAIWSKKEKAHQPDAVDYSDLLLSQKVPQAIDSGKADELWVFGAPNFGFFETCMAGPTAYFVNGDPVPDIPTKRDFVIFGFSYERGVAEMIHDLAHRVENHLARAYGRWDTFGSAPLNRWEQFSLYRNPKGDGKEVVGCGNCHFPPNGTHDYDYANPTPILSNAGEWFNYPNVGTKAEEVSCQTWGGPDYQRNYLKWWFKHLPHREGNDADGRPMNWWKYVFDFNDYGRDGLHK